VHKDKFLKRAFYLIKTSRGHINNFSQVCPNALAPDVKWGAVLSLLQEWRMNNRWP